MPRSRLDWDGDRFAALMLAEIHRRLNMSALLIVGRAKKLLNVDGTGKGGGGRDAKGRYLKGKLKYGANPSLPGEPPRKQTGRLLGSVAWEVVGQVARVGTNILYGRILELGGHFVKPRPWLGRAANEVKAQIEAIWKRPMRGGR